MTEIIDCLNYDSPDTSNIMVIGVGGGGSNAVKYMYDIGIHNVYFMVCNTDAQALQRSPIPLKVQLGNKLTGGLGAGNQPDKGRDAALESIEEIKEQLVSSNVRMVFITAGMGGGTGTGAAPVIAQIARELDILTVGIVTIPFRLEGPKRLRQAEKGLEEIKQHVDSLLVIDNENICKMYGDLDFSDAFGKADDILAIAAKGIAEAITKEHKVNVDFADVHTTMSNSGIALLGYASADLGKENIAIELTERALMSPLLNQNNIHGAQDILINISWNKSELKMSELHAIIGHVQAAAGSNANIIWGAGSDSTLGESEVSLIIIATGFQNAAKIELGGNIITQNISHVTDKTTSAAEPISAAPEEIQHLDLNEEPKAAEKPADEDDQIQIKDSEPTAAQAEDPSKQEIEIAIEQMHYVSLDDITEVKPEPKPTTDDNEFTLSDSSSVVLNHLSDKNDSNKVESHASQPLLFDNFYDDL
ncbi:MAG: cell division protein FtsZ, partial [Rikenellaceae bacterium]